MSSSAATALAAGLAGEKTETTSVTVTATVIWLGAGEMKMEVEGDAVETRLQVQASCCSTARVARVATSCTVSSV